MAKFLSLIAALGMCHYGSLININPSGIDQLISEM